jgi:hypothetical protein
VVQTFYIAIDPNSIQSTLRYIDTQVKYGVLYQYNLTQIRFANSTEYNYNNLQVHADFDGNGRAVGNALGFYLDMEVDIPAELRRHGGFWDYLPWGHDTPVALEQVGHFVLPFLNDPSVPQGDQGDQDLNNHMIQLTEGYGFNSNTQGGAVPAAVTAGTLRVRGGPKNPAGGGMPLQDLQDQGQNRSGLLNRIATAGEMQGEELLGDMLGGRLPPGEIRFGGVNPTTGWLGGLDPDRRGSLRGAGTTEMVEDFGPLFDGEIDS